MAGAVATTASGGSTSDLGEFPVALDDTPSNGFTCSSEVGVTGG